MFIVDVAADFRKVGGGSPEPVFAFESRQLRSIASTVRSAEEKVLNQWISRLLKLIRRPGKINLAFMQIGNSVGHIKCAFHIVGNNDAGHSKALLQTAYQSIDAVGDNGIKR